MWTYDQDWLERLALLLARFSHLGIADASAMSRDELWGVYRFLNRLGGE